MLYSISDWVQGKDIKFVKFPQNKNDVQVYQFMAGLFPSHVEEDGYFCRHYLAHLWILSRRLHSRRTLHRKPNMFDYNFSSFSDVSCFCFHLFFAVEIFPLIEKGSATDPCHVGGQ